MPCVFVLDVFNGLVVHAVRGQRSRYEPIDRYSKLTKSSDPLEVIKEIRPREAYVADLNRLTGSGDNLEVIKQISKRTDLMADMGISSQSQIDELPGSVRPVLGTETASLKLIEAASGIRDVTISIDMFERKVLTRDVSLRLDPLDVLRELNGFQVREIILLELDRVGTSSGIDRDFLKAAASVSCHPLILGGGVKGPEDLQVLNELGFKGALVATAVYDGRIPLEMIR
ncbi:MAG TPA: HisA/HisF-related TIM barrel protein [Methanotrichaceae archaeon]|nr:HisA/HisF-related TIM barrel protein [Methanotrichaceae archaeon]